MLPPSSQIDQLELTEDSLSFLCVPLRLSCLPSYFPLPSFSSSHGSPATQPPLRRLHSGSPLRSDLAGASLCATRASTPLRKGENTFSTPMKGKHPTRRGTPEHVAYFANRKEPRFIEPRRCELPMTFGHPLVAQRPYRAGTCVFKTEIRKRKELDT